MTSKAQFLAEWIATASPWLGFRKIILLDLPITIVSRKYAPPFCNLNLSTKRRGACTWDATISLAIRPPLPVPIKHDLIVGGGEGQVRGGEMLLTLRVG